MSSVAQAVHETNAFPNLRPEVVRGYLEAPEQVVAEVLDGELFLMPRPRPRPALAAGELAGELRGPFDRGKKRRIYRREGVSHYWLLDPREQLLEVLRLEGRRWVEVGEYEGEALVRAEPFEAVALSLALLWTR